MRKLLVFAVMLVLATGLLVSCGGGEEEGKGSLSKKPEKTSKAEKTEPTPVETVRLAYKTTVEEQTARVVSTVRTSSTPAGSTTGDQVPMEFTISSDGLVDLGGERSIATMKMGQIGEMDVLVDPTAPKGATEKVRAQVSMGGDIFDFGVPVNVSPPPPEKTMGYEEFQKQVQQQMQQQTVPTQKS